jgi:CO dehydrogenase maturation factor
LLGSVDFSGQVVVADLEAGVGTLTRLGDAGVDLVLIVVEPTPKSVEVGCRAAALVADKALGRTVVVASRIRSDDDLTMITKAFPDHEVVPIPDDPAIVQADRNGVAPLDSAPDAPAVQALVRLAEELVPSPS